MTHCTILHQDQFYIQLINSSTYKNVCLHSYFKYDVIEINFLHITMKEIINCHTDKQNLNSRTNSSLANPTGCFLLQL